jgi:PAS domain S-box-containing protein
MAAEARPTLTQTTEDRVKILLVDDNQENLLALEATLEGLGQELVKASSGVEALRHLLDDDFAAILLDVRMPDMDGFETATLIRSRKRSRNTPILFLTGYKSEDHLFRGYDLGAVDFLFKPIVPEILQSKVAVFVELARNSVLLRRQANELQLAETRLRAVLDAAPEAMIIFDPEYRIQLVNSEAERLFGYTREQLVGQAMSLLCPAWRAGEAEIECRGRSGGVFPAEISLNPLETDQGGIIISVIRDISARKLAQENARIMTLELERQVAERTRELMVDIAERRRAEQALRESEQRLRVAIHAAQMGLWSADLNKGVMQISSSACHMFHASPANTQISIADWEQLIHPDDRGAALRELQTSCDNLSDYESEYRVLQPDGSSRWILAKGQPLIEEQDNSFRVVGVVQDITHRKNAEEGDRHRHKLESLGILAGGIAHDFNNLLTGILGNASLLLECAHEGSLEKSALTDLVNAADRASQLTRQMLAYSGRGNFVIRPISLADEVREITVLVRASIPRHVLVHFDLEESMPLVDADKGQIQQLIMNLVINAGEAVGADGGNVRIATRTAILESTTPGFYPAESLPPGRYVVVEVSDDGHGMTEATKARIFDPFFTTKFTGRGLGLAAALGIVRGHRGGIHVESTLGRGTLFQVYLPATQVTVARDPESLVDNLAGTATVLVVDDELIVRNLARHSLEKYGYRVLVAEDGRQALDLFSRHTESISLVVLDMAMPGMGGDEVLREMRSIRPDTKVLASSGYSEADARERFGEGVAHFLQKPYTAKQLVAAIASTLRERAVGRN